MKYFDLSGKTALVTGGNGGIGYGMAEALGQAGANVMIAARNEIKSAAAVGRLSDHGIAASHIATNVMEEADCHAAVEKTVAHFGGLDILVNNAGINIRKDPQDYAFTEWQEVIQTNLNAAFICSQAAYPHMKAAGGGKIINIGSMLSIFGASFAAAYAASKGGIVQMTKALACAWAPDNIQVNAVLPGWISTDLTQKAKDTFDGFEEKIRARTPAGRWGEPVDHAGLTIFLAGSGSDFVTGTAIPVDGGYSINGT